MSNSRYSTTSFVVPPMFGVTVGGKLITSSARTVNLVVFPYLNGELNCCVTAPAWLVFENMSDHTGSAPLGALSYTMLIRA